MKRLRITKRFYMIMLAAIALYVGVAGIGQLREYRKIQSQIAETKSQLEQAQLEKDALNYMIQYADSDEYIESIVRDKLGWVKKGETRYEFDN